MWKIVPSHTCNEPAHTRSSFRAQYLLRKIDSKTGTSYQTMQKSHLIDKQGPEGIN